jgi:hypothetical protein
MVSLIEEALPHELRGSDVRRTVEPSEAKAVATREPGEYGTVNSA